MGGDVSPAALPGTAACGIERTSRSRNVLSEVDEEEVETTSADTSAFSQVGLPAFSAADWKVESIAEDDEDAVTHGGSPSLGPVSRQPPPCPKIHTDVEMHTQPRQAPVLATRPASAQVPPSQQTPAPVAVAPQPEATGAPEQTPEPDTSEAGNAGPSIGVNISPPPLRPPPSTPPPKEAPPPRETPPPREGPPAPVKVVKVQDPDEEDEEAMDAFAANRPARLTAPPKILQRKKVDDSPAPATTAGEASRPEMV